MMRRSALSFQDTVKSRLLRLAVLLLLPGLSLAAMVTWQSLDEDRAELATELHYNAALLAAAVDGTVAQTEAQLRLLAASDGLAGGNAAALATLAATSRRLGATTILRDEAGAWLVASMAGQSARRRVPTVWEVPATGRALAVWGEAPDGAEALAITVPVQLAGHHVYNLITFLPRSAIQSALLQLNLREGWLGAVYDAEGQLQARVPRQEQAMGQPAAPAIASALRDKAETVTADRSAQHRRRLFLTDHTPRYAIRIAVIAPRDHVDVPSRLSFFLLVGVGGVLVALGLLGALVVSSSISRPVEALAVVARRLGETENLPPIPGGLVEADQVACAMSAASAMLIERRAALSNMNATLAARVKERTAELADANAALQDERARLGLVLDHIPVGVLVTHPNGQPIYANHEARRLIGLGDDLIDPVRTGALKIRRNGVLLQLEETPPALARHGTVTDCDLLSVTRADGTVAELEVSAGPVLDRDGDVVLTVSTFQEISARLAAEEARRRSQRLEAVGQLTGGVAHEFNNLLMAIAGCLDLLAPLVRGERARGLLENAARASERGATLTKQLLAFARRQQLQAEPVDLNGLVRSLADLLVTTLGRSIEVATDLKPDCWPAMADATQLELVLLNLTINARDAMETGGRIVIGTRNEITGPPQRPEEPPAGSYAVLSVTDSGTGMPPEVLARAFEPFFTTKQVGQGSGLGLPHVLGVAQQLGGGVTIETRVNGGTTVHVFLPRAMHAAQPLRRSSLLPPRPHALEGLRVLLVDDDAEVREISRAMMEQMGALVTEAATAHEALLMLRTESDIDLVLADYTMPHMTGVELAQQMHLLLPAVPVILMTGYSATVLGDIGPAVQAVLQKPFRAEAMAHVVTRVLGTLQET